MEKGQGRVSANDRFISSTDRRMQKARAELKTDKRVNNEKFF